MKAWSQVQVLPDATVKKGKGTAPHPRAGQAGVVMASEDGQAAVKFDADGKTETIEIDALKVLD